MWSALLITAALAHTAAAGQSTAQAAVQAPATDTATPPLNNWVVIVAAPVYQPDGAVAAETVNLPASGAGLVHLFARRSICDPAVAGAAEPSDAGFGWRVASQIVSRSDKDLVVSIDWRRVWDAGRRISNGPGGSAQLTLHLGDRIPLDHIANGSPRADCRAVGFGLEVRVGRPASSAAPPVSASSLPLGATAGGAKVVDAELWLLHTLPSGKEQVTHQVVRLKEKGGTFGFAPATVTTARGEVRIELTGEIDRFRAPTGGEFFRMSMTRLLTGDSLPADGVSSTTSTIFPMPAPTDVPQFDILPTRRAVGGQRGGGGGGAVAAGAGGGAGAGGAGAVMRTPPPVGTGAQSGNAGAAQAGGEVRARGGSGTITAGGGRGGSTANANTAAIAALLEGHQFAIRLRVTQVQ